MSYDFQKSKFESKVSPMSRSRSEYFTDLSDQIFFDDLATATATMNQFDPLKTGSFRKVNVDKVERRLEELLGPKLEVHDDSIEWRIQGSNSGQTLHEQILLNKPDALATTSSESRQPKEKVKTDVAATPKKNPGTIKLPKKSTNEPHLKSKPPDGKSATTATNTKTRTDDKNLEKFSKSPDVKKIADSKPNTTTAPTPTIVTHPPSAPGQGQQKLSSEKKIPFSKSDPDHNNKADNAKLQITNAKSPDTVSTATASGSNKLANGKLSQTNKSSESTMKKPQMPSSPKGYGTEVFKSETDKKQPIIAAAAKKKIIKDTATASQILRMSQLGDWYGVEQTLRFLEKSIRLGVIHDLKPLEGVADEVGWSPLMYALKDNRIHLADGMIELGCDVNAKTKEGMTPLHLGALYGQDEIIKFLIFKRADVNVLTVKKKQSAVHLACSPGKGTRGQYDATRILKVLLSVCPKDIRLQKDADGNIPLFLALLNGNYGACVQLLLFLASEQLRVKGIEPKHDFPIHMVVRAKDYDIARLFVDTGADVDAKNADGQTPLHIAVGLGDASMVKFLYLCKASSNIMDNEERTPMHLAAQSGHTAIIEILADMYKASVRERTKDGSTLMHIASLNGHYDAAMTLHKKGVLYQMPNKDGAKSLHIAARYGHASLIKKLLEIGEKVDSLTNDNYTALHIAVEAGRPDVVEALLGYGAQVHFKGGKEEESPLHIAARVQNGEECALMLLRSGAEPNITMENGQTPLHVGAKNGRLKIVKLLLADMAEPAHKSKDGETPLHFACQFGHVQIVKELLDYIKKTQGETGLTVYINTVTAKGESALHYASKLKSSDRGGEIAQLLLAGGASVYQQTKDTHETAFHYCAREGDNDILKEMLKGMSPVESQRALNKQSNKGFSPLLLASQNGHGDVVETLLKNHARVDVFDNEGRSPLHLAAENGYQEICDMLLKSGAFINSKSKSGYTALHLAAVKGYFKLCLFLTQEHGAYVDVVNLKKQTPLHLAAEKGQIEICRVLLGLRASPNATDDKGRKPIHLAAENNHADVIKMFLKVQPDLVSSSAKDGSTCGHLSATKGSLSVLKQLMKFDKEGVITARIRATDATSIQLAAQNGHALIVKELLEAGASASDENRAGYSAVHLASKNGHTSVIDSLRAANEGESVITQKSRKLGLNALHIAAFFGQTETARELLTYIPPTTTTDPPSSLASSFIKVLGSEHGLTPLHLASFSGKEDVVRLLLNSQGVKGDEPTANFGFNSLHLACRGGHTIVAGLLLSRSSELLERKDNEGRTGLHISAVQGHHEMIDFLLGQGAEMDSTDKMLWTPLHCASKAGHLEVVKLLTENGASSLAKTTNDQSPIWFAAAEGHNEVLSYLMTKDHDSYGLMEDRAFVYNLTICGKNNGNEPMIDFILASPAPVDIAAKLSNILQNLSIKEKERAKDLIAASKSCETMAADLLSLASGSESAGKLLRAVDRRGTPFLDVLIENEQKEVVAHSAVQRYLQELWVGKMIHWNSWKLLGLFVLFIIFPPIWIIFSLPLPCHSFHKIPIIKFMSYLTSHIYLMILICLTSITPIFPILRTSFFPYIHEWILLVWIVGIVISELFNPSDKSGLGWIKLAVLVFCMLAVILHGIGFLVGKQWYGHVFYLRNQLFAVAILSASVQILDFLSFHYLFGPWAIIIGNLMKDLARFLAVLAIFMLGFSMVITSLNQPFQKRTAADMNMTKPTITNGLKSGVLITPVDAFEALFFALFGQKSTEDLKWETAQPGWTILLFKFVFACYLLVTVIVLINLLIAMMSDTYQRIQAQSDIEWKFGLAKLIRNMHRTSATPSPINLFTSWIVWIYRQCRKKKKKPKLQLGRETIHPIPGKGTTNMFQQFGKLGKPTPRQRWKSILDKSRGGGTRVSDIMQLSIAQMTPGSGGSQRNLLSREGGQHHQQRIETVADWSLIAKKYRALYGKGDTKIDTLHEADVPADI